MSGQTGENIKATKRPPSVICIQSIFGLLLARILSSVKYSKTLLFSALVDNVRLSFAHSRLALSVLISFQGVLYSISLVTTVTTCDSIEHATPFYLEERREGGGAVWGKLSLSIFWKLLVLVFISHFGIIAVALGRSLVDYALQIPCISLCFVSGFKKLMCLDLRFKRSYKKKTVHQSYLDLSFHW